MKHLEHKRLNKKTQKWELVYLVPHFYVIGKIRTGIVKAQNSFQDYSAFSTKWVYIDTPAEQAAKEAKQAKKRKGGR